MIHYRDGVYRDGPVELDPAGEAFRYGFGVFETLLWNGSAVCRLEDHVSRAGQSLAALGVTCGSVDFGEIIPEVARRNGLWGRSGRVNLYFPVEHGQTRPVVCASEYARPGAADTWRLALSARPLHTWLAAHKSTNYLYYHIEHQLAREQGFHGAVVTAPDGLVLEAATAALVFAAGDGLVTPAAPGSEDHGPALLPSVALSCAREALTVTEQPIHVGALADFSHAWALNSLAGMRPVIQIGDVRYEARLDLCAVAEERIFRP